MAVLFEDDHGFFICHQRYVKEVLGRAYRATFFDLRTPFLKDLEAESLAASMENGVERKRKRKHFQEKEVPLEESVALDFMAKLTEHFPDSPTVQDIRINNKPSREAVLSFMSSTSAWISNCTLSETYYNSSDEATVMNLFNEQFLVPKHSQFNHRKVESLELLVKQGHTFSLIIIDPPWNNRFIKRKRGTNIANRSYSTMENELLSSMPVGRLCEPGSLVAVWCTNSPSHLHCLMEELLPRWNLQYVATWFWIKVTTHGKWVCPWNGPSGKHPFERLVLARACQGAGTESVRSTPCPDRKLIVSVPCAIHSFKPPLERLLKPLAPTGNCLELFARSLLPDTVSWGDQVPLLQHVSLFEPETSTSSASSLDEELHVHGS